MATKRNPGTQHTPLGVTQGNILVDPVTGRAIDVVEDSQGIKRLAVDANFSAQNIDAEINLDSANDQVAVEDPDTGAHILVNQDGSINVNTALDAADGDNVAISGHQTPIFDEATHTLTSASFETIFTYISSDNNTRILALDCTADTAVVFRLKIDGIIKKILRNSPLQRNVIFEFKEHRVLLDGETLTVEARVDRKFKTTYETFVAFEGYLR